MGAIFYQHGNEAVGDVLGNPACWPRIQDSITEERRNKASFFFMSSKADTDMYNYGYFFKKSPIFYLAKPIFSGCNEKFTLEKVHF